MSDVPEGAEPEAKPEAKPEEKSKETSEPEELSEEEKTTTALSKITTQQLMSHPMVKQMHSEIKQLKGLVQGLPEAIGRAVAVAQDDGPPGPRIPLANVDSRGFSLMPGSITVGDEHFDVRAHENKRREEEGLDPLPPLPPPPKAGAPGTPVGKKK